jgi:hypothetical protein
MISPTIRSSLRLPIVTSDGMSVQTQIQEISEELYIWQRRAESRKTILSGSLDYCSAKTQSYQQYDLQSGCTYLESGSHLSIAIVQGNACWIIIVRHSIQSIPLELVNSRFHQNAFALSWVNGDWLQFARSRAKESISWWRSEIVISSSVSSERSLKADQHHDLSTSGNCQDWIAKSATIWHLIRRKLIYFQSSADCDMAWKTGIFHSSTNDLESGELPEACTRDDLEITSVS